MKQPKRLRKSTPVRKMYQRLERIFAENSNFEQQIASESVTIQQFLDAYWDIQIPDPQNLPRFIHSVLTEGNWSGLITEYQSHYKDKVESYNRLIEQVNQQRKEPYPLLEDLTENVTAKGIDTHGSLFAPFALAWTDVETYGINAKPKGYDQFDSQSYQLTQQALEFKGRRIKFLPVPPFEEALSLEYVARSGINNRFTHDEKPLACLIDGILVQGIAIAQEYLTTVYGTLKYT